MKMILGLATLVVAAGFASAQVDKAADKKQKAEEAARKARQSANARAIQDLELAHQLIRYGRQEKSAEALLLAAQILHRTASQPFKVEFTTGAKADGSPIKAVSRPDSSPRALIDEAKQLSSTPQTEALAKAVEKILQERGSDSSSGPMTGAFTISARQTISWNPVAFNANERVEVCVSTGVQSAMALEIIDENGNVVVRDSIPGSCYRCTWTPRWAGNFRIRLISSDAAAFDCKIYVN